MHWWQISLQLDHCQHMLYVGIIIHRKIILRNERRKVCMNGLIFSQSYVLWVIREYHNGRRIKVFILLDYTNSHLTMIMK